MPLDTEPQGKLKNVCPSIVPGLDIRRRTLTRNDPNRTVRELKMASLLQLRDEAFQESTRAHDRLRHELAVFRNEGYSEGTRVGASYALVEESLMPQISTGCLRLVPGVPGTDLENTYRIG